MVHKKNKKQRQRVEVSKQYEEVREKEIQDHLKFGKPVEEKSDDQLFVIDKKGDSKISAGKKISKVERILAPNPNVEALSKDIKTEENENKLFTKFIDQKARKITKQKQLTKEERKKRTQPTLQQQNQQMKRKLDDLWGGPSNTSVVASKNKKSKSNNKSVNYDKEFVDEHITEQTFKKVNHPAIVTKVKSVTVPEPGMSYNPDYEQHQDTLGVAVAKEIRALDYIKQVEKDLNPDQKYLNFESDEEEEENEEEEKEEEAEEKVVEKKQNERITKKEKNKRMRRAEQLRQEGLVRAKKRLSKQIDNAESTLEKIKQIEQVQSDKKKLIDEQRKEKEGQPVKIGKYLPFEEETPVLMTEQLPKSLKDLSNPQFNPLRDRYLNLQKRNIVENNGFNMKPKPVPKKFFNKNSWGNTVAL
eukprot:gene7897-9716_t